MEEEHIIPAEDKEPTSKEPSKYLSSQKKLFIIAAIILVFAIIGGAFWLGSSRKKQEGEPSPSPTPEANPAAVIEGATESSSPSSEVTSSPSPTPTPTPETIEKVITSTASLDGYWGSNGFGYDNLYILVGRNIGVIQRGFVSFNLSSLPSGAVIESATLRLYQEKIVGHPYGIGTRDLKVDHLNYGDSLGNEDYGASAISASFATLTNNATIEWKDANVTDSLKNDLSNGRNKSQYRILFPTDVAGATSDLVYFESADNSQGTGNLPQLVIKYH
ncbi:DNRLRE domain-containing protein [Patescibacteria group bacterium]|nr:DNRLRE domain-containing protein [Patescibacteria group bacterium]MBU0777190.1 DNRLRE domain-containing protein [Patescibacteria group bacterium]MBU0845885.1 DNRLRE domain-containing protein [Patescibacteria group bacterium]MBU0922912.1 DNRLRE domain-containing protein [Patescibacteria group bacterium]MBU1066355.1 DNRLRE domain-containing protein [Patescibacteria group bacterium]